MSARLLVCCLVLVAACKNTPDVCEDYPGKACVALSVDVAASGPKKLDELAVHAVLGFMLGADEVRRTIPSGADFPLLIAVVPKATVTTKLGLELRAYNDNLLVGTAGWAGTLDAGDHVRADISLESPSGAAADLAGGGDLASTTSDMSGGTCQLIDQTGCGGGMKCTLLSAAPQCAPIGSTVLGGSCQLNADTCTKGALCSPFFDTFCRQMCKTNADCTQPALYAGTEPQCDVGTAEPAQGTKLCTLVCDPVPGHTSGCAAGLVCHVYSPGRPDCSVPGSGTDGTNCSSAAQCIGGYGCYNSGGQGHCRPICRVGTNSDCTIGGQTCRNITGQTAFGACCPSTGC